MILPPWAIVGCSSDAGPYEGDPIIPGGAHLEVVGSTTRLVNEGAEELLEIRYVAADGSYVADTVVEFVIEGDPRGGTLSGYAAPTNTDGIATVTVRAGLETDFDVVATAQGVRDPVSVSISVIPMTFGELEYYVTYAGRRPVSSAEIALFTNITCSDLAASIPSPRESQVAALREHKTFANVEVGVPMAVYALGIDTNDNVAAEACADVELTSPHATVEIPLADMADLFGGTYTVAETFDVTSGFSSSLDLALDILGGLSSDPARYIVDFVAMSSSTPGWLRDALSSSAVRSTIASYLRDAIDDIHVPGYVTDVVDFGAGVNMAFSQLTFDGELTFGEASEFGTFDGTHELTNIRFPLVAGGETERAIRTSADVVVTVGPEIQLAEHTLEVAFGQVVEMVLNDVLLPALPGAPASMTEFLGDLFDCDAIASSIAGSSGTFESIINGVCDIGVTLLGETITDYVTNLWQYDLLTLSGHATLTDADGDYDREHLEDGRAAALWTGTSGELRFDGRLEGERLDDVSGRPHPVRERMSDLR